MCNLACEMWWVRPLFIAQFSALAVVGLGLFIHGARQARADGRHWFTWKVL